VPQNASQYLVLAGQYDKASDLLQQVRDGFEQLSNRRGVAQCLQHLGDIQNMYKYDDARDLLQQGRNELSSSRAVRRARLPDSALLAMPSTCRVCFTRRATRCTRRAIEFEKLEDRSRTAIRL
jgi:hypothetical protein